MGFEEIINDEEFLTGLALEKLSQDEYSMRLFRQAVKEGALKINISIEGEIDKVIHDICCQSLIKIQEILADRSKSEFEIIESIGKMLDESIGGAEHYAY